jgi:hypothetical protein
MSIAIKAWIGTVLCCALSGMALAQAPAAPTAPAAPAAPSKATAQSEAGEPRADTSNAAQAPAQPATRAPMQAPTTPSSARKAPVAAAKPAAKTDRLDLGVATVTGDREQPKVMYIVPWKKSDIGDMTGRPMNSLVDEILSPVDRDVFKREVIYYQAVQAVASQNGAAPKPTPQGEK